MVAQYSANSPKIRKKNGMLKSIEQVSEEMMTNKSGCISMWYIRHSKLTQSLWTVYGSKTHITQTNLFWFLMHMIFFSMLLFSNNKNHPNERQEEKGARGN